MCWLYFNTRWYKCSCFIVAGNVCIVFLLFILNQKGYRKNETVYFTLEFKTQAAIPFAYRPLPCSFFFMSLNFCCSANDLALASADALPSPPSPATAEVAPATAALNKRGRFRGAVSVGTMLEV